MENLLLPVWPLQFNDTMRIAVALVLSGLIGEGLNRILRIPRVCGYALIGLLFGPFLFDWFDTQNIGTLRTLIDLALALLLFELGNRVDLKWFRSNPWIIPASIVEATLTFFAAFFVLRFFQAPPELAATVAAITISTSPAIVMGVAAELRAEGQVTQRLFVFTALNVLYSVVLSKLIVGYMHGAFRHDWSAAIFHPAYMLLGSLFMGCCIALAFRLVRRGFNLSDDQAVVILFGLLLLALSLLQAFLLPTMLAPLLAGVMVKNSDRRPTLWPRHFGTAGGVLVIFLFILTGATITANTFAAGGLAALAVIAVRLVAKGVGIGVFGPVSGLSWRQSFALGAALMPMSALAFLLVEDIRSLYPAFGEKVGGIILCMIAVLQLVGPIAVQWALRYCNESTERS